MHDPCLVVDTDDNTTMETVVKMSTNDDDHPITDDVNKVSTPREQQDNAENTTPMNSTDLEAPLLPTNSQGEEITQVETTENDQECQADETPFSKEAQAQTVIIEKERDSDTPSTTQSRDFDVRRKKDGAMTEVSEVPRHETEQRVETSAKRGAVFKKMISCLSGCWTPRTEPQEKDGEEYAPLVYPSGDEVDGTTTKLEVNSTESRIVTLQAETKSAPQNANDD